MRGGSQSHLVRCSDGRFYVVKFPNNPQGKRVLFNDALGTMLASQLGLPTPEVAVVNVYERLIANSAEMYIELPRGRKPYQPGLCFASHYPSPEKSVCYDLVLDGMKIANITAFAGMLVFDQWTCNTDARQVVVTRDRESDVYTVMMIDQGFCFDGFYSEFRNFVFNGIVTPRWVYTGVRGLDAFELWLARLEQEISLSSLRDLAHSIPAAWYDHDEKALECLLVELDQRRIKVRDLILTTIVSKPCIFPHVNLERKENQRSICALRTPAMLEA